MEKTQIKNTPKQYHALAVITAMLGETNLGGETATPINEDFQGDISGEILLTIYSGKTSAQPDGSQDANNMRDYSIGALEIVGDAVGSDGVILSNRKARLSRKQFDSLVELGLITENNGKAMINNIPCKAEAWVQTRIVDGTPTEVKRFRLVVTSDIAPELIAVPPKTEAALPLG